MKQNQPDYISRAHFMGVAAHIMRQILILMGLAFGLPEILPAVRSLERDATSMNVSSRDAALNLIATAGTPGSHYL